MLLHAEGVVVGEAMVDAYELESKVAMYPRIAVSPRIYSGISVEARSPRLVEDRDGVWHLNNVAQLGDLAVVKGLAPDKTSWVKATLIQIEKTIKDLQNDERLAEAAKWGWLYNELKKV